MDLVFSINLESEESSKRAKGRRLDPTTETIYHMEDDPPPSDVKGLVERLVEINDERCTEENI